MVGETLYISGTNIRKMTTSGADFATLIQGYSEGLGSDGTHIYYADGSTLKRYTITGGAISTVKSDRFTKGNRHGRDTPIRHCHWWR